MTTPNTLAPSKALFLATGLAGALFISLSAQFASTALSDVQGGLSSTPDEASWILTVYTMASFAGIVVSSPLIKFLGIGRYLVASATTFAVVALACATTPDLHVMIALRTVQGFVAGGFGPAAFVAVFMVTGGPRLPFGITLLAFVLLFPGSLGPVIAGFVEDSHGWRALFLIQACIGGTLAVAARAWAPRQQGPDWSALKTDWIALALLSLALAALTLVLSQGTRRFWFESEVVVWGAAVSIAAWAGFAFLAYFSPLPVISPQLLVTRKFGIPIALNLVFRVCLVVTSYLVPQFLAVVHGYRPLEVAELMLWAAIPQLLALPMAWDLLHRFDLRIVMALGFALCACGTALAVNGTALFAAEQFRLTLVIFSIGQLLFLVPAMVVGTSVLKPTDAPTASLAFNATTLGGSSLGIGLVSHFVTEREKLHSNVIAEHVSLYDASDVDRLEMLARLLANRMVDDSGTTASAVALLASTARREAWILAFNDAFHLVAAVLLIGAVGIFVIGRSPPLRQRNVQ